MFVPPSAIDILYDYSSILKKSPLCKLPKQALGTKVAIIGSGAAGIVAAHELLKLGLIPIIYEASYRMGGRLYTKYFAHQDENVFAELGAMRIPQSSKIFYHYAKLLNLPLKTTFPDPGVVDTLLCFKNKLYKWKAHEKPPYPFDQIQLWWTLFSTPLTHLIITEWKNGNLERVRQLWQMYIHQYKDKSFYEVLRERSPIHNPSDIEIFGSMGIGSGGFAPLFQVSFLEILRIMINGYLDKHCVVATGISTFIEKLYHLKVRTPLAESISLADLNCVKLNTAVVSFNYNSKTNNPVIISKEKNNLIKHQEYRAIIFTGSVVAANLTNMTNKTESDVYIMSNPVRQAIKNVHLIASSKTLICTKDKFWLQHKMPSCILTDDLTHSTYFLDYPHISHGIVCLSYTWGMDSLKLKAVEPHDRFIIFRRAIKEFAPNITKYLEPLNGEVLNIDWVNVKYQNGAFKLSVPGNDHYQQTLYYQFQSCLSKHDKGVYLAGDGISWSGGWVEGALYTSINSVFAVAKRLGAVIPKDSPLDQKQDLYDYTDHV